MSESTERPLVERIQTDILAGTYRPGEWVKQIDLETAYDANRFDVRQALAELKERHLVEHLPRRGYRIINPTPEERAQMAEARALIEAASAELVHEYATKEDIAALRSLAKAFAAQVETGNFMELRTLNYEFHRRLDTISRNRILCDLLAEWRERRITGAAKQWSSLTRLRQSAQDHLDMVEALEKRDKKRLIKLMRDHVLRGAADQ